MLALGIVATGCSGSSADGGGLIALTRAAATVPTSWNYLTNDVAIHIQWTQSGESITGYYEVSPNTMEDAFSGTIRNGQFSATPTTPGLLAGEKLAGPITQTGLRLPFPIPGGKSVATVDLVPGTSEEWAAASNRLEGQQSAPATVSGESAVSQANQDSQSITDPNQVCTIELSDLVLFADSGSDAWTTAIGQKSPLFNLTLSLVSSYLTNKFSDGQAAAQEKLAADARAVCTKEHDPVLTTGQLGSIIDLFGGNHLLSTIAYFG